MNKYISVISTSTLSLSSNLALSLTEELHYEAKHYVMPLGHTHDDSQFIRVIPQVMSAMSRFAKSRTPWPQNVVQMSRPSRARNSKLDKVVWNVNKIVDVHPILT